MGFNSAFKGLISCSLFFVVPACFISFVLAMRSLLAGKTNESSDSIQMLKNHHSAIKMDIYIYMVCVWCVCVCVCVCVVCVCVWCVRVCGVCVCVCVWCVCKVF